MAKKRSRREHRGRNFQRSIEPSLGAHLGEDDLTALESRMRQGEEVDAWTYAAELARRSKAAILGRIKRLKLSRHWP